MERAKVQQNLEKDIAFGKNIIIELNSACKDATIEFFDEFQKDAVELQAKFENEVCNNKILQRSNDQLQVRIGQLQKQNDELNELVTSLGRLSASLAEKLATSASIS